MSEQPPLDATFFAFKKCERSFVLTSAAIAYYLVVLTLGAIFLALTWGLWSPLIAWYLEAIGAMSSGGTPSEPPRELVLAIAPFSLLSIPISLLAFAAFEAASLRWLVRGEAGGGLFGLKLDADTWRVFGVYLCWILFFICLVVAVGIFYALLMALGSLGGAARIIAMLLGGLAPIGALGLLIWGAVLFAPAAATSVGRGKFSFMSARRVSSPRYWPLFTSYLLVIIGYIVIGSVIGAILQLPLNSAMSPILTSVLSGGDSQDALTSLREALLTPAMIAVIAVNMLVSLVLSVVYYIAMFGVNARAFEAAVEAGEVERAASS